MITGRLPAPAPVALARAHRAARTRRLAALGARVRRFAAVDTPVIVVDPHALRWRQRRTDHLAGPRAAVRSRLALVALSDCEFPSADRTVSQQCGRAVVGMMTMLF